MPPFKVIIVGGGPAGLIAGHCLAKADIDFVILERRASHDPLAGGSNALWPQSVRVFDQLGLLEEARKIYSPVNHKLSLTGDGTAYYKSDLFAQIEVLHGHPFTMFHRGELIAMLERRLPGRAERFHTDKQVTAIETDESGVCVVCADGSRFEGSMVIGADGVHSTVRQMMLEKSSNKSEDNAMETTYVGLYGTCSPLPKLEPGTFYETHGSGYSLQLGVGQTCGYFLLYHRLPRPTRARHQFTRDEIEAMVDKYADIHFTPDYSMRDVWEAKRWHHMAHIEEGLPKTWYGERVVLLGDAVHKMTPNVGFGFNNGIMSAVALTNGLRKLLLVTNKKDEGIISTQALQGVFADWERLRKPQAKKAVELSALYSRVVAWDNLFYRVVDRYITPRLDGDVLLLKTLTSPLVQEGLVLDFVAETHFKEGPKRWKIPEMKLATVAGSTDGEVKDGAVSDSQ
ncbi:hypothetical protein QBC47DRAFT_389083 [Echria macrotheca]|uniref:FAD-binding domain-containing protein n=1 Tax=Echria macrotheca TaxID=438768 RepID=A0AAJ0B7K1_9PEZI|nr:hypothetical protein QBC47DRAFT_389083 [Echria macrotheca]